MSINPFTKFKDEVRTYIINGKKYRPQNYDASVQQFGKEVTLIDAVRYSLNTIAVQVLDKMDKQKVANFIRKAGFLDSPERARRVPEVLSLALGTCELSSMELATMYSIFCRGGKTVYPYIIRKISDSTGYVYYDVSRGRKSFF